MVATAAHQSLPAHWYFVGPVATDRRGRERAGAGAKLALAGGTDTVSIDPKWLPVQPASEFPVDLDPSMGYDGTVSRPGSGTAPTPQCSALTRPAIAGTHRAARAARALCRAGTNLGSKPPPLEAEGGRGQRWLAGTGLMCADDALCRHGSGCRPPSTGHCLSERPRKVELTTGSTRVPCRRSTRWLANLSLPGAGRKRERGPALMTTPLPRMSSSSSGAPHSRPFRETSPWMGGSPQPSWHRPTACSPAYRFIRRSLRLRR